MVKKKGKSKRITLKDKYKVERRVLESHRKSRKKAKRDSKAGIKRFDHKSTKDPGIPNSWPFKKELLGEIAQARDLAERRKVLAKEQRAKGIIVNDSGKKRGSLEELVARANSEKKVFDTKEELGANAIDEGKTHAKAGVIKSTLGQTSRRAYLQTLRKVIDSSDILLQVLDARDPIGTRIHPAIEHTILSHYDKKMVLVLNKIDLIPKPAVSEWLNYLRKSRPSVAIKCGTQTGSSKVGRAAVDCQGALSSSVGVGVDELMGLLKNYSRTSTPGSTKKSKTCVTVGIIGYPNVGKSSILNTLKRSRAVGVSPRPGHTTCLQEVVLDRNLRLIDSPGVVFDTTEETGGTASASETMLRNCIDADSVEDPIPAIRALLTRCSAESLMMTYSIPAFPKHDAMIFLAMIAKRNGRVLKGGIPDKVQAARTVLRDWNSGKIPYYTRPPTVDPKTEGEGGKKGDVTVVHGFGEAFDVNKMDTAVLDSLETSDAMDFVEMEPDNLVGGDDTAADTAVRFLTGDGGDDDDDMDEDDEGGCGEGVADMEEEEVVSSKPTVAQTNIADAEDYDFSGM